MDPRELSRWGRRMCIGFISYMVYPDGIAYVLSPTITKRWSSGSVYLSPRCPVRHVVALEVPGKKLTSEYINVLMKPPNE